MRSLLIGLVGILLAAVVPAQARQVTLELEAGGVVEGLVVALDSKKVVVEVDGEQRTYLNEQVRKFTFTELANVAPPTPAADPAVAGRDPANATPDPAATPAGQRGAEGSADNPTERRSRRSSTLWDHRIDALDRAYPWLFPAERMQWISLGIMLFSLLTLAVHFAARLAATDQLRFGRAAGVGLWLFLTTVGQMAVLPESHVALLGAVAGNVAVLVILFAIVYGLSFGASVLGVLILGIQGGIAFALLQLVDATLRSIGNTTF